MRRIVLYTLVYVSIGAVIVAGLIGWTIRSRTLAVPFYRSADLTPEWLSANAAGDQQLHRVLPFALTDQHGEIVTSSAFTKHATVIHFFYTTCAGVCPTTQTNLARLLASMPGEMRVQIFSHSVTPERDSVPVLKMYAAMHDIHDSRWHLLTGSRQSIERLARDSYFVNLNNGRSYGVSDLAHTETVVLIDGEGRLRGVYTGSLQLDIDRLSEDIRAVLSEGH